MQNPLQIPTRIGWELLIPLNSLLFFSIYDIIQHDNWKGLYIMFPIVLLINYLFFSIKYYVINNTLEIKSGFGISNTIDITEITKIEKTWNPLASAAPSIMGRVEIYYKQESIIISPRNFDQLQQELLKINPTIIVKN